MRAVVQRVSEAAVQADAARVQAGFRVWRTRGECAWIEAKATGEATLAEATRDHGEGVCLVVPFPLRFKLGYMRPVSLGLPVQLFGKRRDLGVASPAAFGHFGFGGSGAWADPERELSVGVVANSFFGKLPIDLRTVALATAAAYSADARR